jgi:autotransporter-associated beta strand protein
VGLKFSHARRGDLKAVSSPRTERKAAFSNDTSVTVTNAKYQDNEAVTDFDWTFLTNAFWGEQKTGSWTLKLIDVAEKNTGTLLQYGILFHMGKMELQKDEVVDLGNNNIDADPSPDQIRQCRLQDPQSATPFPSATPAPPKGQTGDQRYLRSSRAQESTIDGVLAGGGTLLKSGPGTLTIGGDASTFTGNTTLSGGRIQLGANGILGGNTEIRSGGTLGGTGKVGSVSPTGERWNRAIP